MSEQRPLSIAVLRLQPRPLGAPSGSAKPPHDASASQHAAMDVTDAPAFLAQASVVALGSGALQLWPGKRQ